MQQEAIAIKYNLVPLNFTLANTAANQDGTAVPIDVNAVKYTMPYAGWLVAMSVSMSTDVTAESIVFKPMINTTEYTTLAVTLNTTTGSTQYGTNKVPYGAIPFAENDEIGVVYDSHASYTPTTADVHVVLYALLRDCDF